MTPTDTPEPIRSWRVDTLPIEIYSDRAALGRAAALAAREAIGVAVDARGEARIVLATGNSQLDFLAALRDLDGIDWPRVTVFHMDEYLGIDPGHPASFPRFLRQHLLDHVPIATFHPVPGRPDDPRRACEDYEALLREGPLDLVAMGFGENGHIAFNDPPWADFDDPCWVKAVRLDEVSRRQQVGEGHFPDLGAVPREAITLTVPALLAPARILCLVPETRKAEAVRACLFEPVSEARPGSVLRTVEHARLLLDPESSSLLD